MVLACDGTDAYNSAALPTGRISVLTPSDIKGTLRGWVMRNLSPDPTDVIIDELGFVNSREGSSVDVSFRADLALANGRLVGFEIKSGADSLKRWPSQCEGYFRVFDEVWLCTHGRHLEKALEITPRKAGILLIDDLGGIAMLRPAKKNDLVNSYDLSGLLWRDELEKLCAEFKIPFKKKETKAMIRAKVSSSVSADSLAPYVLSCIKFRFRLN